MWCWAAGVAALAAHYTRQTSCDLQCSVVGWCPAWVDKEDDTPNSMALGCAGGPIECCPLAAHMNCTVDSATYEMLLESAMHFTGRRHHLYDGPMPPEALDATLDAGTPILMLIGQNASSTASHVVSVAGCGGGAYFYHDPETSAGLYTQLEYNDLLQPLPGWKWIDTVLADSSSIAV